MRAEGWGGVQLVEPGQEDEASVARVSAVPARDFFEDLRTRGLGVTRRGDKDPDDGGLERHWGKTTGESGLRKSVAISGGVLAPPPRAVSGRSTSKFTQVLGEVSDGSVDVH